MVACFLDFLVRIMPGFVKNWFSRLVFIEKTENLPKNRKGPILGIVLGGDPKRAEFAKKLFDADQIDVIMTSGGIGKFSTDRKTPEAKLMGKYLVEQGVPNERIWIESRSKNTAENAEFCVEELIHQLAIDESLVWPKLVIITSNYHLRRAVCLFERKLQAANYPAAIFWAGVKSDYAEPINWKETKEGRFLIAKEALRNLQHHVREI